MDITRDFRHFALSNTGASASVFIYDIMKSNMNISHNNNRISNNVFCSLLALVVIAVYLLIDGMGMYRSYTDFFRNSEGASFLPDMKDQLISRIVHLTIMLFPIVFLSIKYHISFRGKNASGLAKWIPCVRLVFGLLFFYYAITLGTNFSHEVFTVYFSTSNWLLFFRIVGAFVLLGAFIIDWPSAIRGMKALPTLHPRFYKGIFYN